MSVPKVIPLYNLQMRPPCCSFVIVQFERIVCDFKIILFGVIWSLGNEVKLSDK